MTAYMEYFSFLMREIKLVTSLTHVCLGEVGRLVAVRQSEVEGVLELFLS